MDVESESLQAFATTLIRYKVGKEITDDDCTAMKADIDKMLRDATHIAWEDNVPRWQSKAVLFDPQIIPGAHWIKLHDTFLSICWHYCQTVPNLVSTQDRLLPTDVRAWFYYRESEIKEPRENPWHNHVPAFLSGVFYLDAPQQDTQHGGTEFQDPRGAGSDSKRNIFVLPEPKTWIVFPSWLYHRPYVDSKQQGARYTIAADCYVRYQR